MWSENSDEDIYITQSTFRQESNLDDVNDWFQDGSSTDGQVLNNNVEKEKATEKAALQTSLKTQFSRSKFKLRLMMRFLNRQLINHANPLLAKFGRQKALFLGVRAPRKAGETRSG